MPFAEVAAEDQDIAGWDGREGEAVEVAEADEGDVAEGNRSGRIQKLHFVVMG